MENGVGEDGQCNGSMSSYAALATGGLNLDRRRDRASMKEMHSSGVSKIGEHIRTAVSGSMEEIDVRMCWPLPFGMPYESPSFGMQNMVYLVQLEKAGSLGRLGQWTDSSG